MIHQVISPHRVQVFLVANGPSDALAVSLPYSTQEDAERVALAAQREGRECQVYGAWAVLDQENVWEVTA